MPEPLAQELLDTVEREHPNLRGIADEGAAASPGPGRWSKKQELGHLLDSAVNNHVRFVRATLDGEFNGPGYRQNEWVALHGYAELPWLNLLELWRGHNRLLVELVRNIPEDKLGAKCTIGAGGPVTLGFVIHDYTLHMQHHLDHILEREVLTAYPSAALNA